MSDAKRAPKPRGNAARLFLLIALVLFFIVRSFNNVRKRMERKEAVEEAAPAAPAEDIVLLTEIRDLLRKQNA